MSCILSYPVQADRKVIYRIIVAAVNSHQGESHFAYNECNGGFLYRKFR